MSEFFNIALVPADEKLVYSCVYLAQTNFKEQSTEYLLGDNIRPHITICQFRAKENQIDQIWSSIADIQTEPLMLKFGHIYVLPGSGIHNGKIWVGLTANKIPKLIKLQKTVFENVLKLGIETLTKSASSLPHLTWARCNGDQPITITVMPPKELWQDQHAFILTIGLSDINGVYKECLFPAQPDLAKRSVT